MRYVRLFAVYFWVSAMSELAYRINFFVQLFQSFLELATAIAGLAVIFSHTNTLGGWRPDEVLGLVGVYILVGGMIRFAIQPGMEQLITSVRKGTLDFILTKPEDAQFLVSVQKMRIWEIIDIMLGFTIMAIALARLGGSVGAWQAAAFSLMLIAGATIVYSFWLILATLSFWLVRVENILTIFQSMYEAGRWPVTLYPGWLKFALTFLVPVAFAVTVPAEALTGRLTPGTALLAVAGAAFLFAASRAFWKTGLRNYTGTSA